MSRPFKPESINPLTLPSNPFDHIFHGFISDFDNTTLQGKIKTIQHLIRSLSELENNTENQNVLLYWASIGSAFGCMACLSGLAFISPIVGVAVAASASSSAALVVGGAIARNTKVKAIAETLQKYKLALQSSPANDWASLWHFVNDEEVFADALTDAQSEAKIARFKLQRDDQKNPLAAAIDYVCVRYGLQRDHVIEQLRSIKNGGNVPQPVPQVQPLPIYTQPTVVQAQAPQEVEIPQAYIPQPEVRSQQVTQIQPEVRAEATQTNSSVHSGSNVLDIVKAIASPIRNCILFGIGGSGKGMLVANALRKIKRENPGRKIFYIDPKNEPGEYGYTDGIVDVVRRKTCYGCCPEEICDWMDEVLDEYRDWANLQSESLLVIDEGSTLGDAAKKCKNTRIGTLILHTASLGGASRKNVWLLAQSPYVGALGLELSATSQITAIALISDQNTNVLQQWKRSPILEMVDLDIVRKLIKESPVNRAVFFGGDSKWYSMPSLPNYSEIDRDGTGNMVKSDALTSGERKELSDRLTKVQEMMDRLERTKHTDLDIFIREELGANDRIGDIKEAIIRIVKERDHYGLAHKFKI